MTSAGLRTFLDTTGNYLVMSGGQSITDQLISLSVGFSIHGYMRSGIGSSMETTFKPIVLKCGCKNLTIV